jgi:tetratricopeptide (TPR) repeat protein
VATKKGNRTKKSSRSAAGARPKILDKHALESLLAKFGASRDENSLERAQDIAWDAWDTPDRRKRISLAKKALAISPLCADAYVLLALNQARTSDDAIAVYRKGVEAGEKALGKRSFREDVGDFWSILETRPYMRVRQGLATALWETGAHEEAIAHYEALLKLNPNDNQGIRYLLSDCLLIRGLDDEAEALLGRYKADASSHWLWAGALAHFRRSGDSDRARRALTLARKSNPYVTDYLLGGKKLPRARPDYISWGGEDEAVAYVAHTGASAWGASPGALTWLEAQVCGASARAKKSKRARFKMPPGAKREHG